MNCLISIGSSEWIYCSAVHVNSTTRPCNNLRLLVYSDWAFFGAHSALCPMGIGGSVCVGCGSWGVELYVPLSIYWYGNTGIPVFVVNKTLRLTFCLRWEDSDEGVVTVVKWFWRLITKWNKREYGIVICIKKQSKDKIVLLHHSSLQAHCYCGRWRGDMLSLRIIISELIFCQQTYCTLCWQIFFLSEWS